MVRIGATLGTALGVARGLGRSASGIRRRIRSAGGAGGMGLGTKREQFRRKYGKLESNSSSSAVKSNSENSMQKKLKSKSRRLGFGR